MDKVCEKLLKQPARNKSKVERIQDVINGARAGNRKVHFVTLMKLGHLKHTELAEHLKNGGRVVLCGDSFEDDTDGYAVFTEQRPSTSHTTAAKVLNTTSQLPSMSKEANVGVPAYTQDKMSDASRLHEVPETECPTVWIKLNIGDPMVPLERNL